MGTTAVRSKRWRKAKRPGVGFWCGLAAVALLVGYAFILANVRPSVSGDRLSLDSFISRANSGNIMSARILDQDSYVVGTYTPPTGAPVLRYSVAYLTTGNSRERLLDVLLSARVHTTIDQQTSKRLLVPATLLFPALLVVDVFVYLILSHNRGTGLFGLKSGARMVGAAGRKVTFADVAGQDAAITELREITEFLSDPERFTALGALVPKGVLLFGPPGCGKTLLARALAGEADAAFYSISGSDFVELYAGVGAARVRDLFREARENVPAVVFIDELDSVGRRRGARLAGDEQEQALNQILTEMDGFSPLEGIVLIGATNRPDVLDPALLRPGRFDRSIGLERPDEHSRLAILHLHTDNKPTEDDVDLGAIARRAVGLSGADLASLANEAALLAGRNDRTSVSHADLELALQRILDAPERQRRLSMRERSFARVTSSRDRVTFADVAGLDEAIEELAEVRDYLADPERFLDMGARPPKGFLVVGPPGCGKTLLARAVATEAHAAFFSVSATEFIEVFVGEGAGRLRDLFAEAKAAAPSIVFLDEIDAIGSRRTGSSMTSGEQEHTLNQILVELDGFDQRAGVTVMAASNRPDVLDEALVRPGRFDRTIVINLPDMASRRSILEVHARGKRLGPDVDLDALARRTQLFSGADLANALNEAALLATRRNMDAVPMEVLEEAVERITLGVTRARPLSDDDRAMVAYHEAGHALVGLLLPGAVPPHKVSIVARGAALGATWHLDGSDRFVYPRSVLIDRMACLLGGRAAEELVFGEPSSGAADDLARVDSIARRMVCELGMSESVKHRYFGGAAAADEHGPRPSDDTARRIDAGIEDLVGAAYERACSVLSEARSALDAAARELLERETLVAEDLARIVHSARPGGRVVAKTSDAG